MSSSNLPEQWSLKDKSGNPPPPNIVEFINKLDKKQLLPCPRSADELQMPDKGTVPREMNSFIIFRRQLAHVAKLSKTSDDGRVISTAASFIWNGASKSEKMSYSRIAVELKMRHREKYPNYTYERRKRKTAEEDFIVYDAGLITQNKNKKKRKTSPESRAVVQHVSEEQKSVPTSTILQEQENRNWFDNSLYFFYGNDCYSSENYSCEPQALSEEEIPQLFQTVMSTNYTENALARQQQQNMQELLLFQQQQQLSPLTSSPTWDDSFYYGSSNVGINPTLFEGLDRQDDSTVNTIYYNPFI